MTDEYLPAIFRLEGRNIPGHETERVFSRHAVDPAFIFGQDPHLTGEYLRIELRELVEALIDHLYAEPRKKLHQERMERATAPLTPERLSRIYEVVRERNLSAPNPDLLYREPVRLTREQYDSLQYKIDPVLGDPRRTTVLFRPVDIVPTVEQSSPYREDWPI